MMRSLLFVPGDSEKKLAKSMESAADALILDLEDAVALSEKPRARQLVRAFLHDHIPLKNRPRIFVRVNALSSGEIDADLDAIMPGNPDSIILPKTRDGTDVTHLAAKLAVREAENLLPDGATGIMAIALETAQSLFGLASYAGSSRRLEGLTWGAEDLAADLGSEQNRQDGSYTEPFRLARTMLLFAAASAGLAAFDTVYVNYRDKAGLEKECLAARRDGFVGKLAIHPSQIATINTVFTPQSQEIIRAQRIIAHFAKNPDSGVTALDGELVDRPHLLRAQRVMQRARAAGLA